MPRRTPIHQFSFANGMLDPSLDARTDVKAYHNGARDLTNVLGLAQGGVETRGGLRHAGIIYPPANETNIRLARFSFSFETNYLVAFSHQAIRVFSGGSQVGYVADGYTSDELADLAWTQSLDTMILAHPDHEPKRLVRLGGGTSWELQTLPITNAPTFNFDAVTTGIGNPSGSSGTITIVTDQSTDFDKISFAAGAPTYWIRINDGLVKVTSKDSSTQITGTVVQAMENALDAQPGDWIVEEDAWSDNRGWPRAVHLFEGRLYFGGTSSRPQAIWGSRAGSFFDFEITAEAFEDESVEMTLDNDQVASVEQLFAANSFFAFTSGGVFANAESPVTPASFFLKRQSEIPAARLRPVELDGAVAFIRRGEDGTRQTCNELIFDDVQQQFIATDLGLLAGNLIDSPVEIAARIGTQSDAANHLLVVNQDGTMAVLNTRRAQNIAGWTRLVSPGGTIRSVVTLGSEVWCLTERDLDGTTRYLIEQLDPDCHLDSAILADPVGATPTASWDGLDILDGETVTLFGDGMVLGEATVAAGAVTTPVAVSALEVGFPFDWAVETMPIEARLTDGTLVGNRHRLIRATVRVGYAQSFDVNGRAASGANLGQSSFSQPLPTFSGLCPMRFLGWSGGREGQGSTVRITGRSTEPASILSITAEVAQ